MKFILESSIPINSYDLAIIPVFNNMDQCVIPTENEYASLQAQTEKLRFNGDAGNLLITSYPTNNQSIVLLAGLGKIEKLNFERVRRTIGKAIRLANDKKFESILIDCRHLIEVLNRDQLLRVVVETIHMALYNFNTYLSKPSLCYIEKTGVQVDTIENADSLTLHEGNILGLSVTATRELINLPAAVLYPESLAVYATQLAEDSGCEISVFNEQECKHLEMKAFLSVGKAAENPPRLIVLRYLGDPDAIEKLALIGKGVTYDTGGLSLKPTNSMLHMKSDMSGASIVLHAVWALAKLKIKKNVIAVVAACENAVSDRSYRPGDIIGSKSGKTIEIKNTDAEGRLTLADAITYTIQNENVNAILDIATLTGAVKVALGTHVAASISNREVLQNQLQSAAIQSGEKFWPMPIDDDYRDLNSSDFADIANAGKAGIAGTISAAAFIESFVENYPWIHLDIAGVSWSENESDYISKGATGRCTRTLFHFAKNFDYSNLG